MQKQARYNTVVFDLEYADGRVLRRNESRVFASTPVSALAELEARYAMRGEVARVVLVRFNDKRL